jgi:hypothetical protein
MKWKVFLISKKIHPIGISLRRLIKHPVLPTLNSLTLLESTTMKRTSFSKSVRAIGLMAMLSVVVATTLQQPIQAQSKVQAKTPTACVPLPEGGFFYDFQGIKFSPKQEVASRKIQAKLDVKSNDLFKRIRKIVKPDGALEVFIPGEVSDKIRAEINKAIDEKERPGVSTAKRVEELTKKYGQYATFSISPQLAFTPEQLAERDQHNRDYEVEMLSIMTPKQQKIYRANLVIKRGFEACDTNKTDG